MPDVTASAGLVRGIVEFAAARGADRRALMARANVTPAELADQDGRIPFEKYKTLIHAAQEMCRDPAFALHYGAAIDMSEVSIVGLIMNASGTMAEAFAQLQRFGRLALESTEPGPGFELARKNGQLWLVDTRTDANDFPELTEVAFARLVCGPRRFLPKPHVLEIHVTYPAPSYRADYDRIFQCPLTFASHWNAMRLHPQIESWRVALQPRYVFGVLTERASELLKSLEESKTVRGRVENLLLPILHTGDVNAEEIAGRMGFTRQTLFRKLKAENVTYREVLNALRHRMAVHYLNGKRTSVNETAYLVGFSDPAAFSRAFKRWTGKSPREMRATGTDEG